MTAAAVNAGFLEAFLRRAHSEPDRLFFSIYGSSGLCEMTNAAVVAEACRWAGLFSRHEIAPSTVVIISLPLSSDSIGAFIGALFAGCVPSFMPYPSAKQEPKLFWESHKTLFVRLGVSHVVTAEANRQELMTNISSKLTILTPQDAVDAPTICEGAIHKWRRSDVACLQHSSGTTGLKKGVMLSFDKISAQHSAYIATLGLTVDDTIVSWLPLYHDMGFVACFLLPLALGMQTILIDPFLWLVDPLRLFELAELHQARIMWLPNFAFNHLVNAASGEPPHADLSTIRAIINCSEPCQVRSIMTFHQCFEAWGLKAERVLTCYAMAEAVFAVTQSRPEASPRIITLDRSSLEDGLVKVASGELPSISVVSSGRPLRGVELSILDDNLRPTGRGRVGQIAVRAPFLFNGYHLEPARSAAAFCGGYYLTEDLGFLVDDDLFVLGRKDDMLIFLGRNVFAHEIEIELATCPGIVPGRAIALGIYNDDIGTQELIVIAEADRAMANMRAIRVGIRTRIESVFGIVPKKIVITGGGWLIKTTSGKLNRRANLHKYQNQFNPESISANGICDEGTE